MVQFPAEISLGDEVIRLRPLSLACISSKEEEKENSHVLN